MTEKFSSKLIKVSIEEHNLKVLKFRCRSFLKPNENEHHGEWYKIHDGLYRADYNVVVPEGGENYFVLSSLERFIEGRRATYQLRFPDIKQNLDDQSYKPLRQLGKLVFNK